MLLDLVLPSACGAAMPVARSIDASDNLLLLGPPTGPPTEIEPQGDCPLLLESTLTAESESSSPSMDFTLVAPSDAFSWSSMYGRSLSFSNKSECDVSLVLNLRKLFMELTDADEDEEVESTADDSNENFLSWGSHAYGSSASSIVMNGVLLFSGNGCLNWMPLVRSMSCGRRSS
ncbi:hypothetical protein OGATHE_003793 [Ogataea polymorpha]|uniref:Uncharacterized protein n=1 Tax=Ogataea polymorpha TaxID=460523 RepID=A0A9P8P3N8_9ASCO|nr:hypothetical protein OGATHE_003793 [Ogataea polymorpha]